LFEARDEGNIPFVQPMIILLSLIRLSDIKLKMM
jgi:hypothetical protein